MKIFATGGLLLLLAISSFGVAQETPEPADVVSVLKVGDRVSLREGPGGFMLFVLRSGEFPVRGDAYKVRSVGRSVTALRYEPKTEADTNRFERYLANSAIVSVGRYLEADKASKNVPSEREPD